ncbi:MAG TPA: HAMP domain-containing sensor histidine kinase [Candidatus Limnocylindria bacterium]|nr:HAMP domain-containing sensor histidine kinase [Candidatus Limnocylindria bacterium]
MTGQGSRPAWWPEGEPPPSHERWRPTTAMFVRFAVAAGVFFLIVGLMIVGAIWLVARAVGLVGGPFDVAGSIGAAIILLILAMWAIGTAVRGFSRATSPVADLVEAADRVAAGDYAVRVRVRGSSRRVRRLVQTFNAMAERLERAESQRRQLLADVTHELRTPLSVIQGKLEGALDGVYLRDDAHLAATLDEVHHMSRIVEDLRLLSLAESGGLRLDRRPTALGEIVDDAIGARTSEASAAGVAVTSEVGDDLPAVDVDATRLREVLDNLLSNAVRYTPAGGRVVVEARPDGDLRVTVSVRDTGRGLGEDEREAIFERFHREPGSRGSGLGLAIARDLVRAHGGEIAAESEGPGRGTTVRFTLPRAEE